mmetsp:Transcript_21018/g.36086  ORF Transcript_21018/g.36086 Transcript_21018/m.36086 type:complete len:298 (+) Transcript_21018:92-985(+)
MACEPPPTEELIKSAQAQMSRLRDFQELYKRDAADSQVAILSGELKKEKEQNDQLRSEIARLEAALKSANKAREDQEQKVRNVTKELEKAQEGFAREKEVTAREKAFVMAEKQRADDDVKELKRKLNESGQRVEALLQDLEKERAAGNKARAEKDELSQQLTQERVKADSRWATVLAALRSAKDTDSSGPSVDTNPKEAPRPDSSVDDVVAGVTSLQARVQSLHCENNRLRAGRSGGSGRDREGRSKKSDKEASKRPRPESDSEDSGDDQASRDQRPKRRREASGGFAGFFRGLFGR